jgi:hypothetical protein
MAFLKHVALLLNLTEHFINLKSGIINSSNFLDFSNNASNFGIHFGILKITGYLQIGFTVTNYVFLNNK